MSRSVRGLHVHDPKEPAHRLIAVRGPKKGPPREGDALHVPTTCKDQTLTDSIRVRDAHVSDIPALEAIIRNVGLFTPEEADGFAGSLKGYFDGPEEGRRWFLTGNGLGAAYLAPEPAPGVWNLLFLGVVPKARRSGLARALVAEVERRLRSEGARLLLIDTSTEAPMEAARALYAALGYDRVALIPDYWAPGDGKLTFRKLL